MNNEPLGLTIARLFQMARKSALQEQTEAIQARQVSIQRSLEERQAREATLNRMRMQGEAQMAGTMVGYAPGAEYLLGRGQSLPYYAQIAAANRRI